MKVDERKEEDLRLDDQVRKTFKQTKTYELNLRPVLPLVSSGVSS